MKCISTAQENTVHLAESNLSFIIIYYDLFMNTYARIQCIICILSCNNNNIARSCNS